jgi:hypothetical protein
VVRDHVRRLALPAEAARRRHRQHLRQREIKLRELGLPLDVDVRLATTGERTWKSVKRKTMAP